MHSLLPRVILPCAPQIASLSSTHYIMANLIQVIVLLNTGTGASSYPPAPPTPPGGPPMAPDYPPPDTPLAPWPPGNAPPDAPPGFVLEPGPGLTFNQ